MRYRNGEPGRTPYTFGPLMCGADPGFGVIISREDVDDGELVSAALITAKEINCKQPISRIFRMIFFIANIV